NLFVKLAAQTATGDASAPQEMRRQLEPAMVHMVRRVLQGGAGVSSIERRIRAEARRLGLDADRASRPDSQPLVRAVARAISAIIVEGVRSGRTGHASARETICE